VTEHSTPGRHDDRCANRELIITALLGCAKVVSGITRDVVRGFILVNNKIYVSRWIRDETLEIWYIYSMLIQELARNCFVIISILGAYVMV